MARKIPMQWVDMTTGQLTLEAIRYLDDLQSSDDPETPGINTILAGVNAVTATTDAIVAGTQPVADVLLSGLGSLRSQQDAQDASVVAVAGGVGGALSGYANKSSVGGTRTGPGSVTSSTVTITATGGTGPYTYAWTKIAGDTITATLPTAATTAFSGTVALGETITATFQCEITDSALATFMVGPIGVGLSEIS
jgi:hypothetical protein